MANDFSTIGLEECCGDPVREFRRWYLVQLRPGGFQRGTSNLNRQGYTTFMPMQLVTRRRRGRLETTTRPLFPGYLFVRIEPGDAGWRKINNTYGISRLVSFGDDRPAEVPASMIAALRNRVSSKECRFSPEGLSPEEEVRVISGPFADAIGRIVALPEKDRIIVLLDMMGQAVRATVVPHSLERL